MTRLDALLAIASGQADVELPAPPDRSNEPVPGEGPLDAEVVVVGESLGAEEAEQRRNFIGRSGRKLREHMQLAGLAPEKCRILNVYPFYPASGSIDNVPEDELRSWQENCRWQVRQLGSAKLIVAVGNVSLETFTGFRDITRRRGSVYEWEGKKVLATVHPAFILRRPAYEKHGRLDWERAKKLVTYHEGHGWYCGCARRRNRAHRTPFTRTPELLAFDCRFFLSEAQNPHTVMAIDVETPKVKGVRQLICVSFAFHPELSLVLPFSAEYREWISALCQSPCVKLGHNLISYDRWWLAKEGIELRGEIRDTLAMHHILDPASFQSLEFLASRYTWEPWWKDQDQGHDMTLVEQNMKEYFDYCGLDSCLSRELHDIFWPMLEARGLVEFYRKHSASLFDPMHDLMMEGVDVDHEARKELLASALGDARLARDRLAVCNGGPLFTLLTKRDTAVYSALYDGSGPTLRELKEKYGAEAVATSVETITAKTVSGTQLKNLLFRKMGLPVQLKRRSTGDWTETTDNVTLKRLKAEFGKERPEVAEVIDLSLLHNRQQKLASFCYDSHFDYDGRFRFSLKLNTEAARLASSTSPNGTGSNSQNMPRLKAYRRIFLPRPGHVLLEVDASQIEGRIVFVRTKDPQMIELARSRTVDQHSYTAHLMTGKPLSEVGKGTDDRQGAKSANHAAMRGMQGTTMADTMLKQSIVHADGTPYEPEECDEILAKYYQAFPGILLWQQRIRREIRAYKKLVNRWGRVWDVHYEEINDDLFRRAYNFLPQSECADLTNICGFVPLWHWLREEKMQSRILLQEHDALVLSCAVNEVYDVALFLREHMEVPLDYDGTELSVPVEFKLGGNWGECQEWSELPERGEMEEAARKLVAL